MRIFGGTNGCEKYLLSKDNGFLDEAFGTEREIVREPSIDPAFERANPGNAFGAQQERHPGAGRFVGSRTVENDVAIAGNLSVALFDLFHSYAKRARDHLSRCLPTSAPLRSSRSFGSHALAPIICARACRACRPTEGSCRSWAAALRQLRRPIRRISSPPGRWRYSARSHPGRRRISDTRS
jgi:hypothetical protein